MSIASVALLAALATSRVPVAAMWTRGEAAVVSVDMASFQHDISVGGAQWLTSLPPVIHSDGAWVALVSIHAQCASLHMNLALNGLNDCQHDACSLVQMNFVLLCVMSKHFIEQFPARLVC